MLPSREMYILITDDFDMYARVNIHMGLYKNCLLSMYAIGIDVQHASCKYSKNGINYSNQS
ncbi:hypothetical protein C922_04479 [Plasmodium inui San Antonio 1]|uniref:Uncharacterized protein n=1 Tax=Plasmodium inui San Antonio 1 TaxID=1237626 RepID=W7A7K9_9APIC|nr:hypothetical protein C922_04479 [Plasmodium inui San Antonio 1]EUD65079.1 hypothetical protein C922_04479 [Plasmodium inui San Antonio 1]